MIERRGGKRVIDHGPTPSPYANPLDTLEADVERLRVRAAQLEARLGITLEEYSSMFAAQAGRCAVCKEHESSMFRGKRRNLTVDKGPDGRVRGLLCSACQKSSMLCPFLTASRCHPFLSGFPFLVPARPG